jgi:structural maintenance of chromosome 4
LTKATVEVTFQYILDIEDDTHAYQVVEGSEFTISRSAHRNNDSQYYIDGKKTSLAAVKERLLACGVDLNNNRFLILQV